MFFENRPQGPFLEGHGADLPPPVSLGAILDFLDFKKASLWTTFFAEGIDLSYPAFSRSAPRADPVLPSTIIVTTMLGPTGFFNITFWTKICSFSVFCFFVFAPFV